MATNKEIQKRLDALDDSVRILSDDTSIEVLEFAITELKSIYNLYTSNIDTLRTRIIAIFGVGLALLSYLYASGKLFIPSETYGRIFYAFGILAMGGALYSLFKAMHPVAWKYPMDIKDFKKLHYFKNKKQFLQNLKLEYIETIESNSLPYEKKQTQFKMGMYLLIIGGIMLLVLKQFAVVKLKH